MKRTLSLGYLIILAAAIIADAAVISGTVSDSATGTGIPGAVIGQYMGTTDTTDANGKYSLEQMNTGAIVLFISASGYSSKFIPDTLTDSSQTLNIKLVKLQLGSFTGIVADSAAGTPIPGAVVSFMSMSTYKMRTDTTSADGVYSFDSVAFGTIWYTSSASGYAGRMDSIVINAATPQTANIKLSKAAYVTMSGKVTDSITGTPMSGAIVSFFVPPYTFKADTTDSNGTYSFDSISMGLLRFSTSASGGYATKLDSISITTAAAQTVNIALAKIVYFTMTGKVIDSTTGTAVSGARIVLLQDMSMTQLDSAVSDANGQYTLDSVYSGTMVNVTATGYATKAVLISAKTTKTTDIILVKSVGVVRPSRAIRPNLSVAITAGQLVIRHTTEPGVVRLFNVKGEMLLAREFGKADAVRIDFTQHIPSGAYVVSICQHGGVLTKLFTIR